MFFCFLRPASVVAAWTNPCPWSISLSSFFLSSAHCFSPTSGIPRKLGTHILTQLEGIFQNINHFFLFKFFYGSWFSGIFMLLMARVRSWPPGATLVPGVSTFIDDWSFDWPWSLTWNWISIRTVCLFNFSKTLMCTNYFVSFKPLITLLDKSNIKVGLGE